MGKQAQKSEVARPQSHSWEEAELDPRALQGVTAPAAGTEDSKPMAFRWFSDAAGVVRHPSNWSEPLSQRAAKVPTEKLALGCSTEAGETYS